MLPVCFLNIEKSIKEIEIVSPNILNTYSSDVDIIRRKRIPIHFDIILTENFDEVAIVY